MHNMIKMFKKKLQMITEDKLLFSKIETKSNNLKHLAGDMLSHFHSLAVTIDNLH